jgi:hypothetical protein
MAAHARQPDPFQQQRQRQGQRTLEFGVKASQLIVSPPPPGRALGRGGESHSIPLCPERGSGAVIKVGEVVMILDLHRQELTVRRSPASSRLIRPFANALLGAWSLQPMVLASRVSGSSNRCAVSARTGDYPVSFPKIASGFARSGRISASSSEAMLAILPLVGTFVVNLFRSRRKGSLQHGLACRANDDEISHSRQSLESHASRH